MTSPVPVDKPPVFRALFRVFANYDLHSEWHWGKRGTTGTITGSVYQNFLRQIHITREVPYDGGIRKIPGWECWRFLGGPDQAGKYFFARTKSGQDFNYRNRAVPERGSPDIFNEKIKPQVYPTS